MDEILNIDLEEFAASATPSAADNYVRLYLRHIIDHWKNTEHEDMEQFLRLSEQKIARAKRLITNPDTSPENIFSIGVLSGFVNAFSELLREEKKDQQIIAMCASQTEKTDRILNVLSLQNEGQGLRHGELAKAVGISGGSLTNIMKRILASRAVIATRSGKNTFYSLTTAGRRYCEKKQRLPDLKMMTDVVSKAQDLIAALQTYSNEYATGLFPGDSVTLTTPDRRIKRQVMIRLVCETAAGKTAVYTENRESPSPTAFYRKTPLEPCLENADEVA